MMKPDALKKEDGFALLGAIFILTVLAALGAYMVTLSGVQHRTSVNALRGVQGYHAAQSGIEWGISQAMNVNCAAATDSFPVDGFTVDVSCQSFPDNIFSITATAISGSYGSADYVSRRLEAKVDGS